MHWYRIGEKKNCSTELSNPFFFTVLLFGDLLSSRAAVIATKVLWQVHNLYVMVRGQVPEPGIVPLLY